MCLWCCVKDVALLVLAFDPGVTTGWALCNTENNEYKIGQLGESRNDVYQKLCMNDPEVVLYENFKHRPGLMKAELYSVQIISIIELWCEQRGITPSLTPLPSEAKAFWSDDKIKALGLWTKGFKHAMDALRVLLLYRQKMEPEWFTSQLMKLK